jgi:hypothetical protein
MGTSLDELDQPPFRQVVSLAGILSAGGADDQCQNDMAASLCAISQFSREGVGSSRHVG